MNGQCVECGEAVDTKRDFYRQIIGWERTRTKGGANAITRRETTGQMMHFACMVRKQVPGQEMMFG